MPARYAAEIGLDAEAFEECYDDEDGEDRTRAATRAADDADVSGTPTFFIDGPPSSLASMRSCRSSAHPVVLR